MEEVTVEEGVEKQKKKEKKKKKQEREGKQEEQEYPFLQTTSPPATVPLLTKVVHSYFVNEVFFFLPDDDAKPSFPWLERKRLTIVVRKKKS